MKTIKTKVYEFGKLRDERAKDRARDWFRQGLYDHEWYDSTYDDARKIGLEIEEFDVYRNTIGGKLLESVGEVCRRILKDHGAKCDTSN